MAADDFDILSELNHFIIGEYGLDHLPSFAIQAIENGYESLSLYQLAGSRKSDSSSLRILLDRAMQELHIDIPEPNEAALSIARSIARDVINGHVTPYEGAKRIWHDIYVNFSTLDQLRIFVGLASEYEDDEKHRDLYSRDIIDECHKLIVDAK